jgi:hypothetical protein
MDDTPNSQGWLFGVSSMIDGEWGAAGASVCN